MPVIVDWISIIGSYLVIGTIEDIVNVFKLVLENVILVLLGITFLFGISAIIKESIKEFKYKNESPEDKKKREELEKIKEWSRRNKC